MFRIHTHTVIGNRWQAAGLALALLALFAGCGTKGDGDGSPMAGPRLDYEKGPLRLAITTSADTIATADSLLLQFDVIVEEGYGVRFPDFPEPDTVAGEAGETPDPAAPQPFTLLRYHDAPPALLDGGRVQRRRTYELEPFLDGAYAVPPMKLRYGKTEESEDTWLRLETEPLAITVVSVLPPGAEPALKDIAGPVAVMDPAPWGRYAFGLLLAAALLGAAYYYAFIRKTPVPPPPPPVPPHQRALEALEAIRRDKLVERGLYKEYYIRVSDVLRHYMEGQFGLHAPERTTEEFLQELQRGALLGLQEQLLLKEFLRHCDLVKFAKSEPTPEEIRNTFDTCTQFVRDTAAAQRAAAAAALEGGAGP